MPKVLLLAIGDRPVALRHSMNLLMESLSNSGGPRCSSAATLVGSMRVISIFRVIRFPRLGD